MPRSGTGGPPGSFSFLWEFPTLIFRVAAPICVPHQQWMRVPLSPGSRQHSLFCWLEPFWLGYDEISIVLTWIALISKDDEPLSRCFLAVLTSSPENVLFLSPAHFFFSLPPVITVASFICSLNWLSGSKHLYQVLVNCDTSLSDENSHQPPAGGKNNPVPTACCKEMDFAATLQEKFFSTVRAIW